MDRLRAIEVFVEVARLGSFSAAARHLGISKASVTKQVAWLEGRFGARLLNRTTKQVGLTEAGLSVLESGRQLLDRYEQAEAEVRDSAGDPRGVIRVGTPPSFGTYQLVPLVAEFTARYPGIQVALSVDEGGESLIAQGLDMSIRIAPTIADASHVALPLVKAPQMLVAAPRYLQRRAPPRSVADLSRHDCLIKTSSSLWRFDGPGGPVAIKVRGSISSNFGEALRQAALLGHGISLHPCYMVADDVAAGRLVPVLPQFEPISLDIHVIFSTRLSLPLRARKFVEFLKDWAKTPPRWARERDPGAALSA